MQVQVSLTIEIAASASLAEMEHQVQDRGQQAMREAFKQPIRQWEDRASGLSARWSEATPPGRTGATGHRSALWTGAGAATALALSRVWASLVSSQRVVRRTGRRHDQSAFARGSVASRLFVAVSRSECRPAAAQWGRHQCAGDPSAAQSAWAAAGGTAASRGTARLCRTNSAIRSTGARRAVGAGGQRWRLGRQSGAARWHGREGGGGVCARRRSAAAQPLPHVFLERARTQTCAASTPSTWRHAPRRSRRANATSSCPSIGRGFGMARSIKRCAAGAPWPPVCLPRRVRPSRKRSRIWSTTGPGSGPMSTGASWAIRWAAA